MTCKENQLGQLVKPRRVKAVPADHPDLPYIGLEHVEAQTTKLLGSVPATDMRSSANRFYAGDVLYSRLRPYLNKVWLADRDGLCSSEFIVMPGNDSVDGRLLCYRLNASDFVSFANSLNAGDRPRVDFDQISSFPIPLFSLSQQRRIVAEIEKQFSRLDEGVAALKRAQANLKRYRAAVLKAACEGRLVENEVKRKREEGRSLETGEQLLARILTERRQKWQGRGKYKEPAAPDTSKLPKLSEGWTWVSIEQLTSLVTSGSRGWGEYYADSGPLFIRAKDIKTDSLVLAKVARVNLPANAEGTRSSVENEDLLITITGANVTKSAIVHSLFEVAYVSQHVALLKPLFREIAPFCYHWIVSPAHGRRILEQWAYGAGKPGLSLIQIRDMPIALPPLAEQKRIVSEVERRLSVIDELESAVSANLQRAARLRQAILQKAFKGELA